MNQNLQIINQYINLKPYRAVQRLLQQNSLQDSLQIYNHLQQTIKQNTLQLRTVLYNNHQNLYECSNTIKKIQQFTQKIKQIQQKIDSLLYFVPQEQIWEHDKNYLNNPLNVIEQLLSQKKYSQALKQCKKIIIPTSSSQRQSQSKQILSQNLYYVKFLKVEIVQNLQKMLQNVRLNKDIIFQAIQALKLFMEITPINELQKIIQKSTLNNQSNKFAKFNDNTQNSLLQLIYQKYQQTSNFPLKQQETIEIIFKYKLFSLKDHHNTIVYENQEERIQILYERIFRYFLDLKQILEESNCFNLGNRDGKKQSSNLWQILSQNIQKTMNYISELFIRDTKQQISIYSEKTADNSQKNDTGITLSFQHELYEKLLSSNEFVQILDSISNHFKTNIYSRSCQNGLKQREKETKISETQKMYEQLDLKHLIKNIWSDYFHQLLDIITQKINPLNFSKLTNQILSSVAQKTSNNDLPRQLKKFISSSKIKQSKLKLQQYKKQIEIFFNNFESLIVRSKYEKQKQSILMYFLKLKKQIQERIDRHLQEQFQALNIQGNSYLNQKTNNIVLNGQGVKYCDKQNNYQIKLIKFQQILLIFFMIETMNSHWKKLSYRQNQRNSKQNELSNKKSIIYQFIQSISQQNQQKVQFYVQMFKNSTSANISQEQNGKGLDLYYFVEHLISFKLSQKSSLINKKLFSSSLATIDNWQIQLDRLLSGYQKIVHHNEYLLDSFRNLILHILTMKLSQIQ